MIPSGRPVWAVAGVLAVLAVASAIGLGGLATPYAVAGRSMLPTLRPGDHVLVDMWTYRHRMPRPGEVVLLVGPGGTPMVKRVERTTGDPRSPGGVLVVGDNPGLSVDSRQFGPVPRERIVGRPVLRYWPPSRFAPIPGSPTGVRRPGG